jgi:hypothetical protein
LVDFPTLYDPRTDAAMPAHGVVTASAQRVLHARTRIAGAGPFKQYFADAETAVLERHQRNPRDQQIAPQDRRQDCRTTRQRRDRRQMFGLQQGDAALAAAAASGQRVSVAGQPGAVVGLRAFELAHRHIARRSHADPVHAPCARQLREQVREFRIRGKPSHR